MASAWRMYVKLATNHPLKVNVVAGFFLAYAGDIVCQHEFESGKGYLGIFQDEEKARKWKWNKERSLELGVLRACLLGPWTHIYYPFLMRTIKGPYLYHAMGRAFLDQFIGSPIVITLVFFGSDFYNMKYSRDLSIIDNLVYHQPPDDPRAQCLVGRCEILALCSYLEFQIHPAAAPAHVRARGEHLLERHLILL